MNDLNTFQGYNLHCLILFFFILFLDSKACISALLLHAVLKPRRISRKIKPTVGDAQEDFILHVKSMNDIEPKIEKVRSEFKENNLKLQPRVLVVGHDLIDLQHFYIYCDNVKYKINSFLKCLDVVIKLTYVFNLKYSHIV